MDVEEASQSGKPNIALALGNTVLRSHIEQSAMAFFRCEKYFSIPQATAGCRLRPPPVVIVGEELPPSNGYDFVHMMRLDPALAAIPAVMIVARPDRRTQNAVAKCGAVGYLTACCSPGELIAMVSGLINQGVEREWQRLPTLQKQALAGTLDLFNQISEVISSGEPIRYAAATDACKPLIEAVANNEFQGILHGVKSHDNYSYAHSMRVATLLSLFAFNLRLSKDEQTILATGGLLHDVGKITIPNEVLNKAGRLTTAEFAVMKGHVNASIAFIQRCPDLPKGILTIAAQHHEKLDGSGYPNGLKANNLDELARMASIIDVFSALTDRRVYKPSMTPEAALALMVEQMASHLDMTLLNLFRQMLLDATTKVAVPA